ncbi:ammonium transporter [Achromatium sp. WMS3]|nr:ammonium transporter [Achromatium sp. WMS3]
MRSVLLIIIALIIARPAQATTLEPDAIKKLLDIVWISICAALVFFMQAGFALLESGMVRTKNAINVMMKNYTDMGFATLAFWIIGYGLMFGTNSSGWIGTDHFLYSPNDSREAVTLIFQIMFAATTATIVSGSLAERIHFSSYVIAATIISAIIYPILGSWVWGSLYNGNGWLKELGFIDFAGSTVVHSAGGWCALAGIIVLGPRLGRYGPDGKPRPIAGHNLILVCLSGFILWLGWFGFNGGSSLDTNAPIGVIILNTHIASSAALVSSILLMTLSRGPVLMSNVVFSSIAGLVAITAGCATMDPIFALITGFVAGLLMVWGTWLIDWLHLDDVVYAVPVHGFCGAWGTIAAGLFYQGDMFNLHRVSVQILGVGVAFFWTFFSAWVLFLLLDRTIGLRVSQQHERRGLDYTEHYEVGYPEFQNDLLHGNDWKRS